MGNLFKTAFGNWSSKRAMSFICLVTAITLAFLKNGQ